MTVVIWGSGTVNIDATRYISIRTEFAASSLMALASYLLDKYESGIDLIARLSTSKRISTFPKI